MAEAKTAWLSLPEVARRSGWSERQLKRVMDDTSDPLHIVNYQRPRRNGAVMRLVREEDFIAWLEAMKR